MANKRPPLSFPELEARGRRAILRSSEEVRADEQALANQQAGNPASQQSVMTDNQISSMPVSQEAGSRASYTKVTYRLSPEAVDAIEESKRELRRRFDIKASLEEIAQEAIIAAYRNLLDNQHDSFLVTQLAGKPAKQKYGKDR